MSQTKLNDLTIEKAEIIADLNRMPASQWGSDKAGKLQDRLAKVEDRLARAGL